MILVTGATGFLGKNLISLLRRNNNQFISTSKTLGLDLTDLKSTLEFFRKNKPKYVLNCAALVGGIQFGYKYSAEIYDTNLRISLNLLDACRRYNVKRLVNPISNCSYPGQARVFKENEFWDGPLHESVAVYGFARKALCIGSSAYRNQYGLDVINIILPNIYGPNDHFEEERSHALGAILMKTYNAKENKLPYVSIWGSGKPIREWIHVDDAAEAMIRSLEIKSYSSPINIGIGKGISIEEMAILIKQYIDFKGELKFDTKKPDGAPCKIMDGNLGYKLFNWRPVIKFDDGVKSTVEWYISQRK